MFHAGKHGSTQTIDARRLPEITRAGERKFNVPLETQHGTSLQQAKGFLRSSIIATTRIFTRHERGKQDAPAGPANYLPAIICGATAIPAKAPDLRARDRR